MQLISLKRDLLPCVLCPLYCLCFALFFFRLHFFVYCPYIVFFYFAKIAEAGMKGEISYMDAPDATLL